MKYPAEGLRGGHRGTPGDVIMNGERMERFVPYQFKSGDEVLLRVPGGGGYGPPAERSREQVLQDVALGLVTPAQAAESYGVRIERSQEDLEAHSMQQAIAQVQANSHGDYP